MPTRPALRPRADRKSTEASQAASNVGWRLAAAGGVSGAVTNCLLFPLDTVKTIRQADPSAFPGAIPAAVGVLRTKGLTGLYAGITPTLIGSTISSALYFGAYEFVRRTLQRNKDWNGGTGFHSSPVSRIPGNAVAAASGNVASSIVFVPKEVVKQRMQAGIDKGRFLAAAIGLLRADGLQGLYRGYKATLLRNIPSAMLRFVLYEEARLLLQGKGLGTKLKGVRQKSPSRKREFTALEAVAAGAVSGGASSAITMPMDVIKTRLATTNAAKGTGIVQAAREIVRERGVAGLYVGIRPRVVWSALFAAIGFSAYEACKKCFAPDYSIEHRVANETRDVGKFKRKRWIGVR